MRSKKHILFIVVNGLFNYVFGQSDSITSINYSELYYEIATLDSNIVKYWDSKTQQKEPLNGDYSYSFANIIFTNLPTLFDKDSLDKRARSIMIDKEIQTAYLWRDTNCLWMIKFSYRSDKMMQDYAKSWVGYIEVEELDLRD